MVVMGDAKPQMLRAKDVAHLCGVSEYLIVKWAKQRESGGSAPGPPYLMLGPNVRRWRRRDVEKWIRESEMVNPK